MARSWPTGSADGAHMESALPHHHCGGAHYASGAHTWTDHGGQSWCPGTGLTEQDIVDLVKLAALAGEGYFNCRLCLVDEPCELHAAEYAVMRAGEAVAQKCRAVVGGGTGSGMGNGHWVPRRGDLDTATQEAYADKHITVLLPSRTGPHPETGIRVQITAH